MLTRIRDIASGTPVGIPSDRISNIVFHGRRVPKPALIRCLPRVMYSSFGGVGEVGIVP